MTPTERAAYRHECRQQRFVVPASTRRHFARKLEHRAFVDVAAAMMQRMHAHLSQGEPGIPTECLTLIFDLAGVSRSRGYDAWAAIQDRGMAMVENGFVIFDFRTVKQGELCPTVGRSLKGLVNPTGRKWNDTSNPPGPVLVPDAFASGEVDGSDPEPVKAQEPRKEVSRETGKETKKPGNRETGKPESIAGRAIAELVAAGADRPGAVKAVKFARQFGHLDLSRIQAIAEAVKALPSGSSYRPGGLLCAAVLRPQLGTKLIHDHRRQQRRETLREPFANPSRATAEPTPRAGSAWDAALVTVRGWATMGLEGPEDLAFFLAKSATITPDHVRAAMPAWASWL